MRIGTQQTQAGHELRRRMLRQQSELPLIERAPDGLFVGGIAVVVLGEPKIGRGTGVVTTQIHG